MKTIHHNFATVSPTNYNVPAAKFHVSSFSIIKYNELPLKKVPAPPAISKILKNKVKPRKNSTAENPFFAYIFGQNIKKHKNPLNHKITKLLKHETMQFCNLTEHARSIFS